MGAAVLELTGDLLWRAGEEGRGLALAAEGWVSRGPAARGVSVAIEGCALRVTSWEFKLRLMSLQEAE